MNFWKWNHQQVLSSLFIAMVCVWVVSCAMNPVKNWKCEFSSGEGMAEYVTPNKDIRQKYKTIIDDYQKYVKDKQAIHPTWNLITVEIYEGNMGQHAVKIVFRVEAYTDKNFFLMYDKSDVRTKVIKAGTETHFHI
jgi:hypothetical protein